MRYLHAMVRVRDLEASLRFFRDGLGLVETRRKDYPQGRFTLVYLGAPDNPEAEIELTYNYDDEDYGGARNFGHYPDDFIRNEPRLDVIRPALSSAWYPHHD